MSEEQPLEHQVSMESAHNNGAVRLEHLVQLLESDHLGYRLERFVVGEREELAQILSGEAFSIAPQPGMTYKDLFDRVQLYDAKVLPYIEFL